jgi:hypothetical protein
MTNPHDSPFAHYPPRPGATLLRLHGGPLDGWEVGVEGPAPPVVRVNGPRHGDHTIWLTHTYAQQDGSDYAYRATEQAQIGTLAEGALETRKRHHE